jgi:hypothetical protein
MWVVIHTCMETTQGISLHSYPYLKLAKTPCFSYYLLCLFFYKIRGQEGGTCSVQGGGQGVWHWWEGTGGGKGGKRMSTM